MIRFYKNCIFEFFISEDYEWSVFITYPDEDTDFIGDDFKSFNAAFLAAIQSADIGLISHAVAV